MPKPWARTTTGTSVPEAGADTRTCKSSPRSGAGRATGLMDLVAAVYRHQVEACAEAVPALLETATSPSDALRRWVDLFVSFLATKHGLAAALRNDPDGFTGLHALFLDRLVPALDNILATARSAGEFPADITAYQLMRAIGDICAGAETADPNYDARLTIRLLLDGCRR